MSFSSGLPYRLETVRLPDGEARAFLMAEDGMPHDLSTLYVTTCVRNASKSVAAQEASLNAINVLHFYLCQAGIDIVERFKQGVFLDTVEVEGMRSAVQKNFGAREDKEAKVIAIGRGKKGHFYKPRVVQSDTQRARITYAVEYLRWLGGYLNGRRNNAWSVEIEAMCRHMLAIRAAKRREGEDLDKNRFTVEQNAVLNEVIEPGSPSNPFVPAVQLRNKLIIWFLRSLGKRKGEVLNIWIQDIKFSRHRVDIVRRADSPDDPRIRQPLVKTREHSVPLDQSFEALIGAYIEERRAVKGARKHPQLFVVHKAGPYLGMPMTISAVDKIIKAIAEADPRLRGLHAHLTRHFHFDTMAAVQISDGAQDADSRETHRRVRNYLGGRRPDSEVDALYTQRAVEGEAAKISVRTQRATMGRGSKTEKAAK